MTREEAHKLIDKLYDIEPAVTTEDGAIEAEVVEAPKRVLPEGKRVVRTKSSGDRIYMIDDVKKTRQWVTNPDVLKGLGFEFGDVVEINDTELLANQMGPALYKVPEDV
jgi:hypothetical protein